jgi:hypothetical protein
MRETRLFGTAFAAALASLLGLGPSAAVGLESTPQSYQAAPDDSEALPVWLVRFKLRRQGYQDIYRVSEAADGFAVRAHDQWGRHVKLFVDARTGRVVPRAGYGLAHLRAEDVTRHLGDLGYEILVPVTYRDQHFQVIARDARGARHLVNVDPLSGAFWFAPDQDTEI